MPFGLSSAPRVFTKLMKPVVAFLRGFGIRLIIYFDDLLIFNDSFSGLLRDLKTVVDLLESLGFIVNYKKSVTTPQEIMEYLGVVINSITLEFSLPPEKVAAIVKLCRDCLQVGETTDLLQVKLRVLASIMGNFNKFGGTRSRALSQIAAGIVQWCEERDILIVTANLVIYPAHLTLLQTKN